MKFKTPFKVLTTAALIGTLSLSAVAPGAASAAEKTTQVSQKEAQENFSLDKVVLTKGASKITISFTEYALYAGSDKLNGYELAFVTAKNGDIFSKTDYALYFKAGDTPAQVIERLSEADKAKTVEGIEEGTFDTEDGNLAPVTGEQAVEAAKADLAKAVEAAAATDIKDAAAKAELAKAIEAAKATAAKEDVTKEELEAAKADLAKAVEAAKKADAEAAVEAKVESVTAINTTSAKVTFGAELKNELTAADFTVKNKETDEKQVVKSVKVADDKKSATIEFYSELAADTTYTVDVKDGEKTASGELVVGKLAPATVEAEDQTVKAATATELKYVIKDVDGVDITGKLPTGYTLNFKSTAEEAVVNPTTGKVTIAAGNSVKVTVQVKKGDEVVAESKQITVSAEAAVASTISAVTVHDGTADFDKVSTTAYGTGYSVEAQAKDQLGDVVDLNTATNTTFTYESQNLGVAVVDKNSGAITPVVESGTAPVKVSLVVNGKVVATKTVNVEIKAPVAEDTITVSQESLLLSNQEVNTATVKVNVKDQYGNAIDASNPTVEVFKEGDKTADNTSFTTAPAISKDKVGEYTLTIKTNATSSKTPVGNYIVKVYADSDKKIATELKVTVKAPGEAVGYVIKGVDTEYDLNTDVTNSIAPKLWTADADGLAVEESSDVKYSVDNAAVTVDGATITVDDSKLKVGDTFKITAKIGPNTVAEQTVTVVDTTTQYTADFNLYTVTADEAGDLAAALVGKLKVAADGEEVEESKLGNITALDLISTDVDVVANDGTITAPVEPANDATVTVLVKSITIEIDGTATPITFETPIKLTVKVAAVPAS